MRNPEDVKHLFKHRKAFKYKGQVYLVSEVPLDIKGFTGAYHKKQGVKCCIINANLSDREKQRTLHHLIKDKNLVVGGRYVK